MFPGARGAGQLTVTGTALWAIALAIWFLLIAPANAGFGSWTVASMPPDWTHFRNQWEYTHGTRAFLILAALGFLVASVVSGTSAAHSIRRYPAEVNAA